MIYGKHLHFRFDKIDGFIRVYDGTVYLVLFGSEKCGFIYSKIKYLIGVKSGITYVISHNYATNKEIFHNVIILIKPVFNKYKNNYYYDIFLEKASYELPKK